MDSTANVRNPVFWVVFGVIRVTHQPLDHHLNFMEQRLSQQVVNTQGGYLCQLVEGKADQIQDEFSALAQDVTWLASLLCEFNDDDWDAPGMCQSDIAMLAIELLGCHSAGYNRRISKECCMCRAYWYRNWAYVLLSYALLTWFQSYCAFDFLSNDLSKLRKFQFELPSPLCAIINDHQPP